MRVPDRMQTRRGYSVAMAIGSVIPAFFLAMMAATGGGLIMLFGLTLLGTVVAAAAAWCLWPDGPRRSLAMIWRGAAIVALGIFTCCVVAPIVWLLQMDADQGKPFLADIGLTFELSLFVGFILGTVLTLGLPWFIGIGISLLFRDTLN